MKRIALIAMLPALGGCNLMADWADRNMPVIGDRCYNWQCFTEGGRAESNVRRGSATPEPKVSDAEIDAALGEGATPPPPEAVPAPQTTDAPDTPQPLLRKRDAAQ